MNLLQWSDSNKRLLVGWVMRKVLSTEAEQSGEDARPSLGLHQAVSKVSDYFWEAEL